MISPGYDAMSDAPPTFPLRKECPPQLCVCGHGELLAAPDADQRILRLTLMEEKALLARIETLADYADLLKLRQKLRDNLGIELTITPSRRGVRTVRGLRIALAEQAGLCRKTRATIPAALRRCLESKPEIVYALLNAQDLLR